MKRLTFLILIIVIISGCSTYTGLSINRYNDNGSKKKVRLHPRGEESFKLEFINKSSQPVFISVDERIKNFYKVENGKSWTYHSETEKDVKYTIKWWYRKNNFSDEKETELSVSLTALYDQGSIIIDNNLLRCKSLQRGVAINYFYLPVRIWDSQGHDYGTLKSGEYKYFDLMSGPITFYWITENPYRSVLKTKEHSFIVPKNNNI